VANPEGGAGSASCGRVLITGGAGFLGQAIVRELRKPAPAGFGAAPEIRIFDVRSAAAPQHPGVANLVGDVRDHDALLDACRGVDVVIHAASLVDYGHASRRALEEINVGGTQNAIRACCEAGARGLVFTSSMDVVYGAKPIVNGDESLPYPERFADNYARTKAAAEQAVVRANAAPRTPRDGEAAAEARLRSCVIRPCGMYGEADPYHVSNVLRAAQEGKLAARIGDGNAVFQHVYVGNVAHAHVLAASRLLEPDSPAAGQIYFIVDYPAVNFFDFMQPLMSKLGHELPPRSRYVPYPVAYGLGTLLELGAKLLRPFVAFEPALTRSSARIVCQDFCFVADKAVHELGYAPIYAEDEALERTAEYFRAHGPLAAPEIPGVR
jgi:nucleoside-diphosphate-sugar epimerase